MENDNALHIEMMAPRYKLLVVEDEKNAREMLSNLLTTQGYEVAVASSGEQAVKMARKNNVIIMDIRLPGIDGFEATRRIQQAQPGKRVVMVTAFPSLKSQTQESGIKVVEVFDKPIFPQPNWDRFLETLNKLREEKDASCQMLETICSSLEKAKDEQSPEDTRHIFFLNAKDIILSERFWKNLKTEEASRRLVVMLRAVMRGLSFVGSPKLKLVRPTREQMDVLLSLVLFLKERDISITLDSESEFEEKLRDVGLDMDLVIDVPDTDDQDDFWMD